MTLRIDSHLMDDVIKKFDLLVKDTKSSQSLHPPHTAVGPGQECSDFRELISQVLHNAHNLIYEQILHGTLQSISDYFKKLMHDYVARDKGVSASNIAPNIKSISIAEVHGTLHPFDYGTLDWKRFDPHSGSKPMCESYVAHSLEYCIQCSKTMQNKAHEIGDALRPIINGITEGYHGGASPRIQESLHAIKKICDTVIPDSLDTLISAFRNLSNIVSSGHSHASNTESQVREKLQDFQQELPQEEFTRILQPIIEPFIGYGNSTHNEELQQQFAAIKGVTFHDIGKLPLPSHTGSGGAVPRPGGRAHIQAPGKNFGAQAHPGIKPPTAPHIPSTGGIPGGDMAGAHLPGGEGMVPPSFDTSGLDTHMPNLHLPHHSMHPSPHGGGVGGGGGIGGGGIGGAKPTLNGIPTMNNTKTRPNKRFSNQIFPSPASGQTPGNARMGGMPMGAGGLGAGSSAGGSKNVKGNSYGQNHGQTLVKPQTQVEQDLGSKVLGKHVVGIVLPTAATPAPNTTQQQFSPPS